jgi:HSP90 family molecular chaperone
VEYRLSSEIARLLRFESSATKPGETVSLDEYIARMQPDQKGIFYLSGPSRTFAESSPYYEAFAKKNVEVLFLYQNIDEFVMNSLQTYNKRKIVSIEKADADEKKDGAAEVPTATAETAELIAFMQSVLGDKVSSITLSSRLVNSAAAIFDHESGAVRRLMKFVDQQGTQAKGLARQKLEINPSHPLIKQLLPVSKSQPAVARLLVEQLFDNCLIAADMLDQPRAMLDRLNKLLEQTAGVIASGNAAPAADKSKEAAAAESNTSA